MRHDSTLENMRLLRNWLERNGRPLSFYTDKASLFQTAPKTARDRQALPPEAAADSDRSGVDIVWIPAHSPQAEGRMERSLQTAQDRLVKGLRVDGAKKLGQASAYLEEKFSPWWSATLTVVAAKRYNAHRPLTATPSLPASLSYVEARRVANNYTIQFDNKIYLIARADIRAGMRGAAVRVELRLDGSLAVRFRKTYLTVAECLARPKVETVRKKSNSAAPRKKSEWMKNFLFAEFRIFLLSVDKVKKRS